MKYVLAIDLGSGGPKSAVVDDCGSVVAWAEEKVPTRLLAGGGAEQNPELWWQGVIRTARRALEEARVRPADIVAVGCDSQWSVVVPVDAEARPLMPAVHWLDARGGPYNHRISRGFPQIQGYGLFKLLKWIRLTGLAPTHSGVDSLGHVLFIKNERPEIYAKTATFLEPMDFITSRLTGKITATPKTMAPFMVVDTRDWNARTYNETLLRLAGLDKAKFPQLIANNGVVGPLNPEVAEILGLDPQTPVVAGISDSNASVIGAGAVCDFEGLIYIGTSLYLTCHVPFKKTDLFHMLTSIPSPFKDRYYLFGEQGAGGKCVEFFMQNLVYGQNGSDPAPLPDDAYERFNSAAAAAPPGSNGIIFLPWLNGSIVPCEDPHVRGGFMNIALNSDRRHMARAVMEGLAYNNRWTREPAEKFCRRRFTHFRFAGGGALSDLWAQIHADVLGVPIHQVDDPLNTTLRGTALLALVSLGLRRLDEIPDLVKIKKIFLPDKSRQEVYNRLYRAYRAFFKQNRKIFSVLNRQ